MAFAKKLEYGVSGPVRNNEWTAGPKGDPENAQGRQEVG